MLAPSALSSTYLTRTAMNSQPNTNISLTGGGPLRLWWAVSNVLAGMPMPLLHPDRRLTVGSSIEAFDDDLPQIVRAGIGSIVNLLDFPSDPSIYTSAGIGYHYMPIKDGDAPSLEQFKGFLRFVHQERELGRTIAVHCAAGLGRTGTVLAGYLIAAGSTVESAITSIRAARHGAIETPQQIHFLHELKKSGLCIVPLAEGEHGACRT